MVYPSRMSAVHLGLAKLKSCASRIIGLGLHSFSQKGVRVRGLGFRAQNYGKNPTMGPDIILNTLKYPDFSTSGPHTRNRNDL